MNCESIDDEVLGTITLRRLENLIKLADKFRRLLDGLDRADEVFFSTRKSSDYDGTPFEDTVTLSCQVGKMDRSRRELPKTAWEVVAGYTETSGDEYSYSKIAHRDNSTAYKMRPAGPGRETKFKLDKYWTAPYDERGKLALLPFVTALETFLLDIDHQTSTLQGWAASGIGMATACVGLCQHSHEVPLGRLSSLINTGLTLEQLSQKLVCQHCKKRGPRLLPVLDAERRTQFENTQFTPRPSAV